MPTVARAAPSASAPGTLSLAVTRSHRFPSIVRSFLVEEQKIVKKVQKNKAAVVASETPKVKKAAPKKK